MHIWVINRKNQVQKLFLRDWNKDNIQLSPRPVCSWKLSVNMIFFIVLMSFST